MPALQGRARDGEVDVGVGVLGCLVWYYFRTPSLLHVAITPSDAIKITWACLLGDRKTVRSRYSSHTTLLSISQALAVILLLGIQRSARQPGPSNKRNKLEMRPLLLVASLFSGAAAFYLPGASQQLKSAEYQLMVSYRSRPEGLQEG